MRALWAAAVLVAIAGAAGCKKRETPPPPQPALEIAWFKGGVEAAFARAREERKPVFLYWGAEWCPYCKDLQANVFSRRDFIEKSRLFVPVYLDGDDAGAQKWGEEFGISGYPTVIVLRGDRTELARIGGGMDRNQYAEVLDLVLSDTRPVGELLASLESGNAALSADDCRRLAYNGWILNEATMNDSQRLVAALQKAIDLCHPEARIERARLTAVAASVAAKKPQSAQFKKLVRSVAELLEDRALASSAADALSYLDGDFFAAAKKAAPADVARLQRSWNEVMDAIAADERYTPGDRLAAVRGKVAAAKALDGKVPPELTAQARQRVDAALAQKYDDYTRAGLVNAALNTLYELGDSDRVYQVAEAEMKISSTPYYYMSDLADIEEERGNKEAAIGWFERAYRESKGTATRFQWGASYVNALLRMFPEDEARIQKATIEVLGELDGPDRLYKRTRARLDKLDANLRKWNEKGAHAAAVEVIRTRMDGICAKIPEAETARGDCNSFLAKSA